MRQALSRITSRLSTAGTVRCSSSHKTAPCFLENLRHGQGWNLSSLRPSSSSSDSPTDGVVDCVVIGAGVIGLAIARSLSLRGREVLVVEEAASIGTGISSRNSEGLYYKTNSLKALLCLEGRKLLYKYCKEKGVPHKQVGKMIVATNRGQRTTLQALATQAEANGVKDIEVIDRQTAQLLEPEVNCVEAILSPSTGIIDSHSLMLSLQADAEANGALFSFGTTVMEGDMKAYPKELKIKSTRTGEVTTLQPECVVNAAGLRAWDVAKSFKGVEVYVPSRYYAKGSYFSLTGASPFARLIYPIPEEGGLGMHATVNLQGQVRFGPDVEWVDELDYRVDPERALSFYPTIRSYYPGLPKASLKADYSGIRPKVVGPGEPPGDFKIQSHSTHIILGLVNLFGIESPGLTASLAIGDYVAEILDG